MQRVLLTLLFCAFAAGAEDYVLGPDSQVRPDVPHGTVTKLVLKPGKIYPGTPHDCQIDIPANYDPRKPLPYMVFLDGNLLTGDQARVPVVFDNLIASHSIPPDGRDFCRPWDTTCRFGRNAAEPLQPYV